ncbi:hypothetical protein NDU88_000142 [Pleurodeles waltl]|uniref:Uncharacterized protein n=1 Tax=Pleurodeles waltl TaxID=8319 RepID=A0AAV7V6Z2_PLEWA|nr:hypothetical protein NDU88_000141 [Pleurodeles waltl]KAJ1196271.1 hypothetical protein NDU88_000142 [Pleurodeles waltl]
MISADPGAQPPLPVHTSVSGHDSEPADNKGPQSQQAPRGTVQRLVKDEGACALAESDNGRVPDSNGMRITAVNSSKCPAFKFSARQRCDECHVSRAVAWQQGNLYFGLHLVTKPWSGLELRQMKQVKRAGAYEVLRYARHGVHRTHNVEIYEESHVFRSILRDAILALGR